LHVTYNATDKVTELLWPSSYRLSSTQLVFPSTWQLFLYNVQCYM